MYYYTKVMSELFLDSQFPDTKNTYRGMTTMMDFWRVNPVLHKLTSLSVKWNSTQEGPALGTQTMQKCADSLRQHVKKNRVILRHVQQTHWQEVYGFIYEHFRF